MDPQQPGTAPGNNYDFIVNPSKPAKVGGGGGSSFASGKWFRILVVAGGILILMMFASFVSNLLFGDKTNIQDLNSLTQTQTEIMRIAKMGEQSDDQNMRNAAVNTMLVVTTNRREIAVFAATHGGVDEKAYNAKRSRTTDTQLTRAKATSTFDVTYAELMHELMTAYAAEIKTAHGRAYGNTEKTLLNKHYEQTQILIKQIPK